ERDERAGKDREVWRGGQMALGVEEQPPPCRLVRREPKTEEAEAALRDDRRADPEGGRDDHWPERVREDVSEDDPPVGGTHRARRHDELTFLQRQESRSHQSRHAHPVQQADDENDEDEDPDDRAEEAAERLAEQE